MPEIQVPTQSVSADISRGAVQILREYTGRGPTKARTVINHDYIAIVLEDTMTKGERSLAATGKEEHVLETRRQYQRVMANDLTQLVEGCSGRKVAAMLSDNHIDPDVAVEFFVLAPTSGNGVASGLDGHHQQAPTD
jgi:uncharacterized protein YbcI